MAKASGGYPCVGARRSYLQKLLYEKALSLGVEFHFGKRGVDVRQTEDSVTIDFADGTVSEAFSFVIACDGINSSIRTPLFGDEKPTYTGMSQVGICISQVRRPELISWTRLRVSHQFQLRLAIITVIGNSTMQIPTPCFVNVSPTHTLFACTLPEAAPAPESWGAMSPETLKLWKESTPFIQWEEGVGDVIRSADRVVKVCDSLIDATPAIDVRAAYSMDCTTDHHYRHGTRAECS